MKNMIIYPELLTSSRNWSTKGGENLMKGTNLAALALPIELGVARWHT